MRLTTFLATMVCSLVVARGMAEEKHTTDTLETVQKNLAEGEAVLFDVREVSEWKAGHLTEALLLPLSELRDKAGDDAFAKELAQRIGDKKVVYCHCARGRRALVAAELLRKLGYDVRALKPGYAELVQKGFKIAPTQPASPAETP